MAVIDRAKALHNVGFGDLKGVHIPVTTLHADGQITSGGYSSAATSKAVHNLELREDVGVSTSGLRGLLGSIDADAPDIRIEGNVLALSTPSSNYSIGLTDPVLEAAPSSFPSSEELNGNDPFIRKILKRFPLFASTEVGKEQMHSLFFNPAGIFSIDGYQIASVKVPLSKLTQQYSVHEEHVKYALKAFADDFKIRFGDGKSFFYDDETRWMVSAVKAEVRDWTSLIPDVATAACSFSYSDALADAVQAVSKATESSEVVIQLGTNVLDVSTSADVTAARESVEVKGISQDECIMKFNAKMLLNVLRAGLDFHSEPVLHMNTQRSAATVVSLSSSFTAMAMRV